MGKQSSYSSSLGAAYFFGWNNTDLIWGFWTASFIIGNMAILRGLASPLGIIRKKATPAQWKKLTQFSPSKQLGGVVLAIVLLCGHLAFSAFLALHFSAFNLDQAWVLQILFPHPGLVGLVDGPLEQVALDSARILPASYWLIVLHKLLLDCLGPKAADCRCSVARGRNRRHQKRTGIPIYKAAAADNAQEPVTTTHLQTPISCAPVPADLHERSR